MSEAVNFLDPRLPDRFWEKAQPCPISGCWIWTGAHHRLGYGDVWFDGRRRNAHAVAYRILVGKVRGDHELDHRCRVRCCVNPAHLEPVTHAENMRRAIAWNNAKAHCPKNHPYDVFRTRNGKPRRSCQRCMTEAQRRYKARRVSP